MMLAPATAGPTDETEHVLKALLERLDIDADRRIGFVETRQSDLLDESLEVHGILYRDNDRLIRKTTEPREQTHALSERHVEIHTAPDRRRRFSLNRAPELRVLRQALLAILERDHGALEKHFSYAMDVADDDHWTLALIPKDPATAERVERFEILGVDRDIQGMRMRLDDGEVIETRFKPEA